MSGAMPPPPNPMASAQYGVRAVHAAAYRAEHGRLLRRAEHGGLLRRAEPGLHADGVVLRLRVPERAVPASGGGAPLYVGDAGADAGRALALAPFALVVAGAGARSGRFRVRARPGHVPAGAGAGER